MKYERKLKDITDYKDYGFTTQCDAKNPWLTIGETTYILINNGYVAAVNTLDFWELRLYSYSWGSSSTDPSKDYVRTNTYDSTGHYIRINLQQLILGKKTGYVIDHIDGNHYNNKRSNLRHVTAAENANNKHDKLPEPLKYNDKFFVNALSFNKYTSNNLFED